MNPRARSWSWIAAIAFALCVPTALQAQEYEIRGTVADSLGGPLTGAMVVALAQPDSVLTEFTSTNGDGAFVLRGLRPGEYILQVTLLGYGTYRDPVTVNENVDAGAIQLAVMAVEMDPLVVTLDHVPFLNNRDTLGYNALAFETRPNATVEDLLRRLPGIEVETDGSITAQGEEVENVLVDGREFFGSDPTIATRGLPADAVERVEVYDKESDTAEFTGIPDGEEERTINLELKEEARTGYFGQMAGGLGAETGDPQPLDALPGFAPSTGMGVPYDGSFSINRFSPTTQLALIGGANNVNRPAFGGDFGGGPRFALEVARGGGGNQFGGSGNDGFVESMALGANLSREFSDRTWIRSSYFMNQSDNLQNQVRERQQLFGSEVSSLLDQASNNQSDNVNHRFNLNSQFRLSEGHELRLRGNLGVSSGSSVSNEIQETRSIDGGLLNSAVTNNVSDSDNLTGNARLTWRKRLSDNGRSIIAEARADLRDSDGLADLTSTIRGDPNAPRNIDQDLLQEQIQTGRSLTHSVRLSWTEPLAERTTLEFFGERRAIDEDEDLSIFDLNSGQPVFNDFLSSGFERTYTYLRSGFRFNKNNDKIRLVFGLQVQNSDLQGTVLDRSEDVESGYTHLLPNADLRLQLGDGRNLNFRYNTSTREPSMTQLQPFTDNTNPLSIYTGNPDLEPEYTHRFSTDYRFFDSFSFLNIFAYANANLTTNNISTARQVDDQGLQMLSPVNTGSEWGANGGLNFGKPIRSLGIQFSLDYNLSYSSGTELINSEANDSRIIGNRFGFNLENRDKDRFDVRVGTNLSFNNVNYSLNEELNQTYLNSTFFGNGSLYLGPWTIESGMNYRTFDQGVFGPAQSVALREASVTRLLMNDRAEIELTGFDLLNQNQGVRYTNSSSYIQEQRIESLGRFVMLKFSYRLGPQAMSGRGGGPRGDFRRR